MDGFTKSLVIHGLLDPQSLLGSYQWEPLAEGVNSATLYQTGEVSCRAALLHYLPGASVATHRHAGFEHILILHGSQHDGDVVYRPGTLVIHKPGTSHSIYSPHGCIALGIWEKPVEFMPE